MEITQEPVLYRLLSYLYRSLNEHELSDLYVALALSVDSKETKRNESTANEKSDSAVSTQQTTTTDQKVTDTTSSLFFNAEDNKAHHQKGDTQESDKSEKVNEDQSDYKMK